MAALPRVLRLRVGGADPSGADGAGPRANAGSDELLSKLSTKGWAGYAVRPSYFPFPGKPRESGCLEFMNSPTQHEIHDKV